MDKHQLATKTKPVLMVLLFCLIVLSTVTRLKAATTFTFTLPTACTTSAGVYNSNGTLVRTLWRKVNYPAGTYTSSATASPLNWDDKDDKGNTMPAGTYQIRILYHNVTYTWEGVIGNTSSTFTGTGAHFNFQPITAMAFSGTNGYYCAGYDEAHYDFTKFSTSDPQTATNHFAKYYDSRFSSIKSHETDIYCRSWALAVADSTCIYYASPNCYDTTANNDTGKPGFVIKYNRGTESVAYFTVAGQQLPSGPIDDPSWGDAHQFRVYPSAISVGTQPGVSGLAVQTSGNVLAVSVGPDGTVYLYDKTTGSSLGTIAVANPQGLAFAPNGDLWVITGTSLQRYTSVGTSNTLVTTITGLSAPLAVAVHPTDNNVVLVADGGTSQQVKGYTSTGASASGWSTPYGQAGGFATNGPTVTNDKFWFRGDYGGSGAYLAFQSDGSFWVGDEGNGRTLHFSSARAYLGQIQYRRREYVASVDLNAPTRVFYAWNEFQVDYTKTLTAGDPTATGGNNCWKLVKNWGNGVTTPYVGITAEGLQTVVTLNNGRTWALVNRSDSLREIAELQTGGLHFTGITFSSKASLYANGDIRDYQVTGGVFTITRRQVSFDSAGTPTWAAAITLASAPVTATDPYPHAGYTGSNGPRFPITSNGSVVSFDSSAKIGSSPGNLGMHLGGIPQGGTQWLWQAAPGYTTGGVNGNQPDLLGSYSIDGDSFGGWDGTNVWATGQNVLYNYNGQWSNFMNQFMHFWEDGLFVGQFGVTKFGISFPSSGPVAGFASNAISPCLVQVGNTLYAYQSDEMVHSGIHRWRIDGANSIAELTGIGTMDGTIAVTHQTTRVLNQDFETATSGSFTQVTSTGSAQSPSSRAPDGSLHAGRISTANTTGLSYSTTGLTAGNTVTVSCQANNDNTSGDTRGFVITTFVYLTNGTVSRRFDTTTSALSTWQTLTQNITIASGEDHMATSFSTAFNQPKAFADNITVTVTK